MRFTLKKWTKALMVLTLTAVLVPQSALPSQNHIVKPEDLQKAVLDASQARQDNIAVVEDLLSTDEAKKVLGNAGIDQTKIEKAIALLSDEELAQLASQARQVQSDFAAGEISDRTMLYVLIFVAVGSLIAFLIVMP